MKQDPIRHPDMVPKAVGASIHLAGHVYKRCGIVNRGTNANSIGDAVLKTAAEEHRKSRTIFEYAGELPMAAAIARRAHGQNSREPGLHGRRSEVHGGWLGKLKSPPKPANNFLKFRLL